MHQSFVPAAPPAIEDVKGQFEAWRNARQPRQAIPTELWNAAVSLCGTHRPSIVARELRLNYTKLKDHLHSLPPDFAFEKAPTDTAFIELDFGARISEPQCVIEIHDCKGGKTTIELKGDQCPDPVDICKAFWSR